MEKRKRRAFSAAYKTEVVDLVRAEGAQRLLARRALRAGRTVLEIDAGPMKSAVGSQNWSAPEGVDLIEGVSVEEYATSAGRFMRTRLTVPASANTTCASWAGASTSICGRPSRAVTCGTNLIRFVPRRFVPRRSPPRRRRIPQRSMERPCCAAVASFDEIEPFLISAVTAPNPDVLPVMEKTLVSLKDWMRTIDALDEAVTAVKPDFAGDRAAQAHNAIARFRASVPLATDN